MGPWTFAVYGRKMSRHLSGLLASIFRPGFLAEGFPVTFIPHATGVVAGVVGASAGSVFGGVTANHFSASSLVASPL